MIVVFPDFTRLLLSILLYNYLHDLAPNYLSELVPLLVKETATYNLQNSDNIQNYRAHSNPFLNSFFPLSIRAYNNPSYDYLNTLSGAGSLAFIVLRMSCYCNCSVILPHGAVGRSALCDCDIS